MIALSGDRTLLLKVFARKVSPCDDGIAISSVVELPNAEIVALFSSKPHRGDLPHTIVVSRSHLRDFFAWTATYLGHWSPLTSRVRVIRRIDLSDYHFEAPEIRRLSFEVSRALSSLLIGEALLEWRMAGEKTIPPILSLRSTFGYAAFKALLRSRVDVSSLLNEWERAQKILRLESRRILRRQFLNLWEPIMSCLAGRSDQSESATQVTAVLAEIIRSQSLPAAPLQDARRLFDSSEFDASYQSRENAVLELEKWISRKSSDRSIDKLYTACLATRLSPGALSHFDVLAKMTGDDPEVMLWYSFISGLLASEPSTQVVERMMFRLSGDFGEDDVGRCGDISIDELDVLAAGDGHVAPWIGIGAGFVNVELKSGICATFRIRDRQGGIDEASRLLSNKDTPAFERLLEQLKELYYREMDSTQRKRRRK